MSKSVQIPISLFYDLCRYHLPGAMPHDFGEQEELENSIESGLQDKLFAMGKRQLYTTYKDPKASPETREAARQAYLDMVGMLPGYRWPEDWSGDLPDPLSPW